MTGTAPDVMTRTLADDLYAPLSAVGAPGRFVPPSGDTTGADDLAAIQAAIDAASASASGSGMTVWIEGDYWINDTIQLADNVTLAGTGWDTTIHLAPGANCSMIEAANLTKWWGLRNFTLDGHKENQTGGGPAINVLSGYGPGQDMASCSIPILDRLRVMYSWGTGVYLAAVETRARDLFVFRCGTAATHYGIHAVTSDQWLSDCTVGESFGHGFVLTDDHRLTGCKSWWSGYQGTRGVYTSKTIPAHVKNTLADGYYTAGQNNQLANCEAQDPARHAFNLDVGASYNRLYVSAGRVEGSVIALGDNAVGNTIDVNFASASAGASALRVNTASVVATGNTPTGNIVRANGATSEVGVTTVPGISKGFDGTYDGRNEITIGTPGALHTVNYAATLNPEPIRGGVDVTLAGNVTIANPPAHHRGHGMEFAVVLTQDGTGGRTVTWGSDYRGASAADTAAGKVNRWTFRCVKAQWVQVGYVAY